MATLRNKRKLKAVSRETPESTRNSRAQNTIDPELARDYISQVSEEIEERVTKKFSKEFSRTESRILGALSAFDEFLLNPQVRTCSVVVPGTSGSSNSENQEPTGDRSLEDSYPEMGFSSHHFGNLNNPGVEDYPHSVIHVIECGHIFDKQSTTLTKLLPLLMIAYWSFDILVFFFGQFCRFRPNWSNAYLWIPSKIGNQKIVDLRKFLTSRKL